MTKKNFLLFIFSFSTLFAHDPSSPILLMVGTRPEAIKMFPVYQALIAAKMNVRFCTTGQHGEMVDEFLQIVGIEPDYAFKIMKPGQDLFYITESVLKKMKELIQDIKPSLIVVQGDTTTAFASALAAFYLNIPIAHIEAGLRSGNIYAPFPEEINRRWISSISSLNFTPTSLSTANLINEGVKREEIFCTGNTVVDALYAIQTMMNNNQLTPSPFILKLLADVHFKEQRTLLLTAHRRESFEGGIHNIFIAAKNSLEKHPNLTIIYPMHPNPLIKTIAEEVGLLDLPNLHILPPLPYQDMIYLLTQVDGVMTDSGGIQEEAVSLCKPVLVLRNETDRPEGLLEGCATLVGTDVDQIEQNIDRLMKSKKEEKENRKISPYGDGQASPRIAFIIKDYLEKQKNKGK